MAYQSPAYEVERELDDVEIRRDEPCVVAETDVQASLERAGNGGFRRLAGYIFGGNRTVDARSTWLLDRWRADLGALRPTVETVVPAPQRGVVPRRRVTRQVVAYGRLSVGRAAAPVSGIVVACST